MCHPTCIYSQEARAFTGEIAIPNSNPQKQQTPHGKGGPSAQGVWQHPHPARRSALGFWEERNPRTIWVGRDSAQAGLREDVPGPRAGTGWALKSPPSKSSLELCDCAITNDSPGRGVQVSLALPSLQNGQPQGTARFSRTFRHVGSTITADRQLHWGDPLAPLGPCSPKASAELNKNSFSLCTSSVCTKWARNLSRIN